MSLYVRVINYTFRDDCCDCLIMDSTRIFQKVRRLPLPVQRVQLIRRFLFVLMCFTSLAKKEPSSTSAHKCWVLQCLLCRHINFVMVSYKRDITETKLNSNQLIYKSTLRRPHAKGTKWLVYMQRSSSLLLVKVSPKILRTQTRRSQTVLFTRSGSHR